MTVQYAALTSYAVFINAKKILRDLIITENFKENTKRFFSIAELDKHGLKSNMLFSFKFCDYILT